MLLSLLWFVIVLGLVYYVVSLIPLPEPFASVVKVIFIIVLVVGLLNAFGVNVGGGFPQLK